MFMELVYLMILLISCDALAEIRSLKYLNMYLVFVSILGIRVRITMGYPLPRMGKGMGKNSYPCTGIGKLTGKIFSRE
jgi:hypothetical protein